MAASPRKEEGVHGRKGRKRAREGDVGGGEKGEREREVL